MTHLIVKKREECENQIVDIVADAINRVLSVKEYCVLAIPGGKSVPGIYKKLADKEGIPWEKVHIFMLDERLVHTRHRDSNFKQAFEILIDELIKKNKIPEVNVHPFLIQPGTSDRGIDLYTEEIKLYGGSYDIILASAGVDGHIGALFRDHDSYHNDETYYITMKDAPKPPAERMSASKAMIRRSKIAIIVFFGTHKQDSLKCFKDPQITTEECPAKLIMEIPEYYVFADLRADGQVATEDQEKAHTTLGRAEKLVRNLKETMTHNGNHNHDKSTGTTGTVNPAQKQPPQEKTASAPPAAPNAPSSK